MANIIDAQSRSYFDLRSLNSFPLDSVPVLLASIDEVVVVSNLLTADPVPPTRRPNANSRTRTGRNRKITEK